MPQFRIAIGYRTAHRHSEPKVIASGFSPEALQAAIDDAPPEIVRIEIGTFRFAKNGRRRNPKPEKPQESPSQPAESTASEEVSPSPEQTGEGEQPGDDGPTLLPVPETRPPRRGR